MNDILEPFQVVIEAGLVLLSAFPFLAGLVVGFVHRAVVWTWVAIVVGYRRGRYGKLD